MLHDRRAVYLCAIAAVTSFCFASRSGAHAVGENYVWLNVSDTRFEGRFEIHERDLREKLGIDLAAFEGSVDDTARSSAPRVHDYIRNHFAVAFGERELLLEFTDTRTFETSMGRYVQYFFKTPELEIPERIRIRNSMLFENDRFHRSLLLMEYNRKTGDQYGAEFAALIFSPTHDEQTLDLTNIPALLKPWNFIWQGILHIWIGIDHILFLLALLLPAVLVRDSQHWTPVSTFRAAFWNVLKIVTLFTVAHSITLSLAALEIVQLPPRLVESVIALSIILVAINCIYPRFREGTWVLIFFFGLFHGLGFASVMGELPFRMVSLLKVLLGFNIGVEIGQIAIVIVLFPIIFLLRNSRVYVPVVLRGGALLICVVASYWFVERAFALS